MLRNNQFFCKSNFYGKVAPNAPIIKNFKNFLKENRLPIIAKRCTWDEVVFKRVARLSNS